MVSVASVGTLVGRYVAVIIAAVAILTLAVPSTGLWIETKWVNYLLMVVMFGMGLTLKFEDFKVVFTHPKYVVIGCVAQFTIMPLLAFVIGHAFGLSAGLLAGVVLVGTCPGGTSSNVMTYLAKGDVPLSVGMTSVNTLLAPILTPLLTYLLLQTEVEVNMMSMFTSIVEVIIIPIALGLIINRFFGKQTEKVVDALPVVSVTAIALIVACVVSHNSNNILNCGAAVFAVVILHNGLGYLFGYLVARFSGCNLAQMKAMSLEVGMQNSGLATSLAVSSFAAYPMASVPGAIFSVWHNISGAILAGIFRRMEE